MAANDTSKLAVIGTVSGQQHIHTLHFRHVTPALTEADLIAAWQAAARTTYRAFFRTADNPCEQYQARHVCGTVPLRAGSDVSETAGSIAGTRSEATEAMAPWLATVVTLRTPFAGRTRRGRFFLGGLAEGGIVGALVSSGVTALVQDYVDDLMTAFVTSGGTTGFLLVVYSRVLAAVPDTECQDSSTPVSTMQVRNVLASMKSRKAGSGI